MRLDAVALDGALPDADGAAARLRRKGVRVVMLEEEAPPMPSPDGEGITISIDATVAALANALVPGLRSSRTELPLTTRERQVLTLASEGLCAKQIAHHLGLSTKTIEHHKSRVFVKLGVPNQAAAVRLLMAWTQPRTPAWNPSSI